MKNKNPNKITTLFLSIFIILVGFLFNVQNSQAIETSTWDPTTVGHVPDTATPINDDTAIEVRTIDPAKAGETIHEVNTKEVCGGVGLINGKCFLVGILNLNSWFLAAAAALFGFVVDADKLQKVVADPALYTVWMEVRDFLNIAFILFLLYSAFSIIFQIGGKFGEKKIILTIVLMALLVNFSFPIARFIVDASNSLMYTLLVQFFPASAKDPTSIFTGITTGGAIETILKTNTSASYTQLFAAIIFTFLLAMTFLALAVLFLIRIVALAILIIISPVAFVGNIAGKDFGWWDSMIKYAFFGPIMIFVLHIAIFTMTAVGNSANLASSDNIISAMANMIIPIVILWMGMGIAQKMGVEGASAVVGKVQGWSKSVGKAPGKAAWWATKKGADATGIPGGIKQKWSSVKDKFDAGQKSREARIAARLGVTGATVKDAETRSAEYEKNHESDASLIIKTEAGDAGAALALVKKGKMDETIYGKFMTNNKDASLNEHVAKKVKKNRVDILIKYNQSSADNILKTRQQIATESGRALSTITNDMAKSRIADNEMKKLSPEDIKTQYWGAILDAGTPDIKRAAKRMFAGISDDARSEIGKGQSSSNRKSINKLRSAGFI